MSGRAFAATKMVGRLVADRCLDIRESLVDRAAAAFTDTIGVALAGAAQPSTAAALHVARAQFGAVDGVATAVTGVGERLSASGAALVNAVAAHALDYDDVSSTVEGHPSAVLVPMLLALAEGRRVSGRDVIEAYLVGLHVSSGVGAGFNLRAAYARGWHTTSVLGALGAGAAAARLRRLDMDQARTTMGIVGSVAAGSRASFGTMVKPLHVGQTAMEAILAVELAEAGYSANPNIIEAPLGFLALHAESDVDWNALERALSGPVGSAVTEVDVKRYPCCYHAHRMIDATLAVRSHMLQGGQNPKLAETIEGVRITTAPGGTAALLYHSPVTPAEAKFSAEYVVATALMDGAISDASFQESTLERPAVRALMKQVEVGERDLPPLGAAAWEDSYAVVEVLLRDGGRIAERVDVPKGSHANPLTAAELSEKFLDCVAQHPSRMVDGATALRLASELGYDDDAGSLLRRILSPEEAW